MTTLALTIVALVLVALAALQIAVASGKPYGRFVWGGQHRVLPTSLRIGSAVSVAIYGGMVAILASRADVIGGGESRFIEIAAWVLVGFFTLGILVNGISRSRPERFTMTPVNVVLAACSLAIALH